MSKVGSSVNKEEEEEITEDEMQATLADDSNEDETDLMLTKEGMVVPMSEPEPELVLEPEPVLEIKSTEDEEDEDEDEPEKDEPEKAESDAITSVPDWLTSTEPPKGEIDPDFDVSSVTGISEEEEEEMFGVPAELTSVPDADRLEPDDLSDLFEVPEEDVMGYSGVDDEGPDGSDDLSDVTDLSKEDEKELFSIDNLDGDEPIPKKAQRPRRIIMPQSRTIYPTLGGLR